MKEKSTKKIFGGFVPRKSIPLPPKPTLPQLPKPSSKASKPVPIPRKPMSLPPRPSLPQLPKPAPPPGRHRREVFEPILSRPIELDKFAMDAVLLARDADGDHVVKTCMGDIYKIVNALMDYSRLLELVCDEWNLQGFHRATYEYHAEKLRAIAKKYQSAIGYDYDAAVAKCEAKKKRARKEDDIGGDALELALKRGRQNPKKKEK